ncbi:putative transposase [Senna tora]|uniref:Putative transposase n=1 Tax=Senna tora TaxID=362788 RepID=A0A834XHV5_9FABA|nr:putative transposase [Senna tora]
MNKGAFFKEKGLARGKNGGSPIKRSGFDVPLQAKSSSDLLRQFKKEPNQNVAKETPLTIDDQQSIEEVPQIPKKLKRKPMCPPSSMDDFLHNVGENDIEKIKDEVVEENKIEQIEEDINHNEIEEENDGDIRKDMNIGTSKKRTRGQTSCKKIHDRSIEEREEVILNDQGQPIGPREKTVKDLSLFLGKLARNSTFCPS